MDCQTAQERLLGTDVFASDAPASVPAAAAGQTEYTDLLAHLEGCADCRRLAAKLRRLEEATRALPLPPGSHTARAAFLGRLQPPQSPADVPADVPAPVTPPIRLRLRPRRDLRLTWPRLAVAASVLLCLALGLWLLTGGGVRTATAAEPVVDRLVQLNVDLAATESPAERGRIFAERGTGLKRELNQAVGRGTLPPEERDLARTLMDNGAWLASAAAAGDDPLGEAERFGDVADLLLQKMDAAAARGDTKAFGRYSRHYVMVTSEGVAAKLERAGVAPAAPARRKRLERMLRRDAELRQRLERLLDESPDAARQEIRRALEIARKHRQAAAAAKPAAGKPAATTRPAAGVGTKGPGGHRKNAQ